MTVQELIDLLGTYDPSLPVAYSLFSEQCMLEASDIAVHELCEQRNDGWVQNARPDKKLIPYLLFPGN
ncbi:MAG: hypothetical protein EOO61_03275 [Hymenobacter sp.]|nr:MAG: hypothetical protein EOO61_03275 [Hymenobacter sp.]